MRFSIIVGCLLFLCRASAAENPNEKLFQQFIADNVALMKSMSKRCDLPEDVTLDQLIAQAPMTAAKYKEKNQTIFVLADEEIAALRDGKSPVDIAKVKQTLIERRDYKTPISFAPILSYYLELIESGTMNNYQLVLAYRIAEHTLASAKERDRNMEKIQKNKKS